GRRRSADQRSEQSRRPQLASAGLALDGEGGREGRGAGRAARSDLPAALRAGIGKLVLPLLEVALREPAAEADGDPVTEHLAPLFAEPVGCLAHDSRVVQDSLSGPVRGSAPLGRVSARWRSRAKRSLPDRSPRCGGQASTARTCSPSTATC